MSYSQAASENQTLGGEKEEQTRQGKGTKPSFLRNISGTEDGNGEKTERREMTRHQGYVRREDKSETDNRPNVMTINVVRGWRTTITTTKRKTTFHNALCDYRGASKTG